MNNYNKLSNRQKEVCSAFIKSKGINCFDFIAKDLILSKHTVKAHISTIFNILKVNSQPEMMCYLLTNLYINPLKEELCKLIN